MNVTVSLPDDDVEFLDSYAQARGMESRSAVVHEAVALLRVTHLGDAYEDAWDSWEAADEARAWEAVTADGLAI